MYAHQVLEDLAKYKIDLNNNPYREGKEFSYFKHMVDLMINKLVSSIKIHIKNPHELFSIFKDMTGKPVFSNQFGKYINLPFPCCWFDYRMKNNGTPIEPGQTPSSKRGVLAVGFKENIFMIFCFAYNDIEGKWSLPLYKIFVSANKKFGETDIGNQIINKVIPIDNYHSLNLHFKENENILPVPFIDDFTPELIKRLMDDDTNEISTLQNILVLLNCKNISLEKNYPSKKLNLKRQKKGKLPLYSYKTLVLHIPGARKKIEGSSKTDIKKRLHFCRGHFKEFTEGNKLFGKYTGLYWWQPHLRGDKKIGMVMKDYRVMN